MSAHASTDPMHICYAYEWDAGDVGVQSGRPHHILEALRRRYRVSEAFPLDRRPRYGFAPLKWAAAARGRLYHTEREPFMLRYVGRQIDHVVARTRPDVVFAPSSIAAAAMTADVPIVYCADSNVYQLFQYYQGFERIDPRYERHCHRQERIALARCAAAVFPSEWAAEAAVRISGADAHKVHVVPFGANIRDPGRSTVEAAIASRSLSAPRLLFIGSEWLRKGGDIVLAACAAMRARGVAVELDLVGVAEVPVALPPHVRHHGVLRKRDPTQLALLTDLLSAAHLLFVPSRAECFGMTFCEAAAFGVPAVSCRTGGIPTVIRHGETGLLLDEGSQPEAYAEAIAALLAAPERYRRMASAIRADYEVRLNWPAFVSRLITIVDLTVTGRTAASDGVQPARRRSLAHG